MVPATAGVTVKVVALMLEGFIALLKVAVTVVFGQTPFAPLAGITETTVGGVTVRLTPALSGSLHAAPTISDRSAVNQIIRCLCLRMTVILLPLGGTTAAH